jgi:hypothetical protein
MSSMDADSRDAQSGDPQTGVRKGPHVSFWIRELPFSLGLILTLLGVAYTSFLKHTLAVHPPRLPSCSVFRRFARGCANREALRATSIGRPRSGRFVLAEHVKDPTQYAI